MDKDAFERELRQKHEGKADNVALYSTAKRNQMIEDLLRIAASGARSPSDFKLKQRYEILRVGNSDRLIRKRKDDNEEFKFVAAFEEVFDIIKSAHEAIGHGGGKKTIAEIKKKVGKHHTRGMLPLYFTL